MSRDLPRVRLGCIRTKSNGTFELPRLEWPSQRAAVLSLRIALRGEPQPVKETPWAVILTYSDAGGKPAGEAAWLPGQPGEWWLAPGSLPILGLDEIAKAACFERPLTIVPSPEAWLEARESNAHEFAACVLNWTARLESWLYGPPAIVPATPELARALDSTLSGYAQCHLRVRCLPTVRKAAA